MSITNEKSATSKQVGSFYAQVCALGFELIALAGVAILLAGVAGNSAGAVAAVLVIVVIFLLIAVAVMRLGRWTLFLAAALSFALLGLTAPFASFPLSHPESVADFVPILLLLAGALLGLIGSIAAIVEWRRRKFRASATRAERIVLGVVLGTVAVAVSLSLVLTQTSQRTLSAEAKASAVTVEMKNFEFAPHSLQVRAGETVHLLVKNEDATMHTLTLPQAKVDVSVPPGSERLVEFKAPAPGIYQWYCIPHTDSGGSMRSGMVGTLQVQ